VSWFWNCLEIDAGPLIRGDAVDEARRPIRGFSDCKEGGSIGALRSLGLVGVALRGHELNGWGDLVGAVLVVLAQENNFLVGLAGAWR
jgi:hypothetical protein